MRPSEPMQLGQVGLPKGPASSSAGVWVNFHPCGRYSPTPSESPETDSTKQPHLRHSIFLCVVISEMPLTHHIHSAVAGQAPARRRALNLALPYLAELESRGLGPRRS